MPARGPRSPWTPQREPGPGCAGNDFVAPEDVQAVAPACLAHRVHLSYEAEAAGKSREDVVDAILERVAVAS